MENEGWIRDRRDRHGEESNDGQYINNKSGEREKVREGTYLSILFLHLFLRGHLDFFRASINRPPIVMSVKRLWRMTISAQSEGCWEMLV